MSNIKGPTFIVKCISLVFCLTMLGLTIASRPGPAVRKNEDGLFKSNLEVNSFFQICIISTAFSIVSLGLSAIGGTKTKIVGLADAGAHILVAILLVMYSAQALENSINSYNDFMDIYCEIDPNQPTPVVIKSVNELLGETEDMKQCVTENSGNYKDTCRCQYKVLTKYDILISAFAFGAISSLGHIIVGLAVFAIAKRDL